MVNNVRAKLIKGAAWLTLARLSMNSLGFISTIILARILSPNDFGIFAISSAALAIAMSITDLSLNSALVQRNDLLEEHFHSVWTISLIRSIIIIIIFLLLAIPLSNIYGDSRLAPVLAVAGLAGALPGLKSPKVAMLTRELQFHQEFIIQIVQKFSVFAISISLALIFHNYWSLVLGGIAGSLAGVLVSYLIAPYLPNLSLKAFRELFSYSLWLSLGDTINTLNWKLDQLILGYLIGKTPLGIYAVGDNLAALPIRESVSPIVNTLFPAFSRIKDQPERLRAAYLRSQTLIFAIALPVGCGFAATANLIVPLLMGSKWQAAVPIIQLLSAAYAFQAITTGLQPLAMAKGETKTLFRRDVRNFLIRIPFVIIGYLTGGLMGVVVARCLANIIATIWNMSLVKDLCGIGIFSQIFVCFRTIISVISMIIAVTTFQMYFYSEPNIKYNVLPLFYSICIGAFTYLILLFVSWICAGRPQGAEAEFFEIAQKTAIRIKRYLTSSP